MKTRASLLGCLFFLAGLTSVWATPSDTLGLLGLSPSALVEKLGKPKGITGEAESSQCYEYAKGLMVSVFQDTVTSYAALTGSDYKSDKGIKVGADLEEVMKAYGAVGATEEAAGWEGTDKERVLYHHTKANQYKINYQSADVAFLFGVDKKVVGIFVSTSLAKP